MPRDTESFGTSCLHERKDQRADVEPKPEHPVAHHAAQAISQRRWRSRGSKARAHRRLQDAQGRHHRAQSHRQGRPQCRCRQPSFSYPHQQASGKHDADPVVDRPPPGDLPRHPPCLRDRLVVQRTPAQMPCPAPDHGEVQDRNAQALEHEQPEVHGQRGAGADQDGCDDEVCRVHVDALVRLTVW